MLPVFKAPEQKPADDFAAECKRRFALHCQARAIAPFHKDKRVYTDKAWAEVDAYLDWLDISSL